MRHCAVISLNPPKWDALDLHIDHAHLFGAALNALYADYDFVL